MKRTKRLTLNRALEILQLRYGTQVQKISKIEGEYIIDSICLENITFTRNDILKIEDDMYCSFGC